MLWSQIAFVDHITLWYRRWGIAPLQLVCDWGGEEEEEEGTYSSIFMCNTVSLLFFSKWGWVWLTVYQIGITKNTVCAHKFASSHLTEEKKERKEKIIHLWNVMLGQNLRGLIWIDWFKKGGFWGSPWSGAYLKCARLCERKRLCVCVRACVFVCVWVRERERAVTFPLLVVLTSRKERQTGTGRGRQLESREKINFPIKYSTVMWES